MKRFLGQRPARVLAAAVLLVGLYAAAGFLLAPKILRSVLIGQIQKNLGVTPALGEIRFNPFLLQLEVRNFALPDANAAELVGFNRLFVDFELASLWHRAYVFKEIAIDAPFVRAVVGADGSMNLLRLRPKPSAPPTAKAATPLPSIEVTEFEMTRGSVSYEDLSEPEHFRTRLDAIDFDVHDFTTGIQGGAFNFTGVSKLGERIEWRGRLSLQPMQSSGQLRIVALRANTLWAYLKDRLGNRIGFIFDSGTIDVDANYRFALKNAVDLQLNLSKASVRGLGVGPTGSDQQWIGLSALEVTGATLDLPARKVHVDAVSLTGLKVSAWLTADRSLNLSELAGAPTGGNPRAASQAAPAAPAAPGPAKPWRVDLGEFKLVDASLSAEDRSVRPAAKLTLAPLSLSISGASSDLTRPIAVSLDTGVNAGGRFAATGQVVPQPLAARMTVEARRIGLDALQPYIAERTALTLLSGRLSGKVQLRYGPGRPAATVAGSAQIDDLRTVDNALHDDLIKWRRLDVRGAKFQLDPNRLGIDRIVARDPYARVIIAPDRSVNIKRILSVPASPAAAASEARIPAPANRSAAPARKVPEATMPISIGAIDVIGGRADFSDLSITPNFAAGISELHGGIRGLTSNAESRATVDLQGDVGPYAPVSITGEVNLFGPVLYTDLAMNFRNMDLTIFNPYSGKFAGYNITKGKLTTELHYKINGRKLDAQHHIVIDQLEFGAKTASKDAVSLPVKLAVALLKDRHGVIDLNLPVAGSFDDPHFRLGPLIWKVLINLLTKAVTAPFALLGSLLGAGPDIQYVDFAPGSAVLDAQGVKKLQEVGNALIQRPQLKVDVPISPLGQIDRPALVDARFEAKLQAERAARSASQRGAKAVQTPNAQAPAAQLRVADRDVPRGIQGGAEFPGTNRETGLGRAAEFRG